MKKGLFFVAASLLTVFSAQAQCTWTNVASESFEYNSVIPGVIPGTTYQNTPQTFAGCVHSGTRGLYLNFVDGFAGIVYDQQYTNLCIGHSYRFSFWTKDTWGASNNMTFRVLDLSNNVLSTQTVITNGVWQNVVMPSFVAAVGTVRFQVTTNTAGGPGNDAALDDIAFQVCSPNPVNTNKTVCASAGAFDLYNEFATITPNGTWSGPSALTNGTQGTFTPGTNTNGLYTYTIDGGGSCPDSVFTVQVQIVNVPSINAPAPVNSCGPYTLPAITGTNLSGNQRYYTGPNGTGTILPVGSAVNTSQTIYLYDGAAGCSDQETMIITISAPSNAGNDNGASYCGPGPLLDLDTYRSASSAAGGTWAETTATPSGTFDPATGSWPTSTLASGTYTFSYTVPGNGACPADVANFTIILGNIPSVDLGNDTTLCQGQTMWLNAGAGYDVYLWNNGSTNPTRFVSAAGTYWVRVGVLGPDQIINGGFESGVTNFNTQYTPGAGGTWGLLSNPGTYAITSSPNLVHNNFGPCNDHTPNPGVNQMVVNGADVPNTKVWCQTVPVQPNTNYQFGTWVTSVENGFNVAQLQFSINNAPLGGIFSPPTTACNWTQFTQTWASGVSTSAEICIVNQNIGGGGNDFALDDITFRPLCYSYDTVVVAYSPLPVVNLGPTQNHCEGTTVTLDAQNAGSTYLWNTTETTQTISPTASGTYSVTVTNAGGCTGSGNVTVNFEAQKHAGNDSSAVLCNTQNQVDLNTLLTTGVTTGGTWEVGQLAYPGAVTPAGIATATDAGIFDFDYIVTGTYCPNDTSTMLITVNEQPVAAANQSLHFCNTSGDQEDLSPYLNHPQDPNPGLWATSAGFPAGNLNTTTNVLDLTGMPHGNYELYHVLPADSMCVNDTLTIDLQITAVPVIDFVSDRIEGCQPVPVTFTNQSTVQGAVVYQWDLGNGDFSGSNTTASTVYEAATCYDITLTATADGLCTSTRTITDMICVHPLPHADFTYNPQQVYSDGPTVSFTNNSTDNDLNDWNFGDGGTSIALNPEHTFPIGEIGNYLVELIVTSQFGCVDTASQIIIVKDQLLYYVPNTFTPDGDEHNNEFRPIMTAGMDPHDYQLSIYNRWGELLFESNDISIGWDGTYNGEFVQEGTYVWTIRFGMMDTDEIRTDRGHINLFR